MVRIFLLAVLLGDRIGILLLPVPAGLDSSDLACLPTTLVFLAGDETGILLSVCRRGDTLVSVFLFFSHGLLLGLFWLWTLVNILCTVVAHVAVAALGRPSGKVSDTRPPGGTLATPALPVSPLYVTNHEQIHVLNKAFYFFKNLQNFHIKLLDCTVSYNA